MYRLLQYKNTSSESIMKICPLIVQILKLNFKVGISILLLVLFISVKKYQSESIMSTVFFKLSGRLILLLSSKSDVLCVVGWVRM